MSLKGSSPLARGLLQVEEPGLTTHRIIPARAGFTDQFWFIWAYTEDHPRSRGVYLVVVSKSAHLAGSSPLARGLQCTVPVRQNITRIIPARAGFTTTGRNYSGHGQDHPRSRGVYRTIPDNPRDWLGSSPLARGLPRQAHQEGIPARIIPARAGFTPPPRSNAYRARDHPRSRGVYIVISHDGTVAAGSSPLARGLQNFRRGLSVWIGIIPARAGFTSPNNVEGMFVPDHPRSRGVYY